MLRHREHFLKCLAAGWRSVRGRMHELRPNSEEARFELEETLTRPHATQSI